MGCITNQRSSPCIWAAAPDTSQGNEWVQEVMVEGIVDVYATLDVKWVHLQSLHDG